MDLEVITLSKVSQKGKDKYHVISLTQSKIQLSLTCGIKIQHKWTYLRNRLTDKGDRIMVAKGEEIQSEFGISRCKLLYVK